MSDSPETKRYAIYGILFLILGCGYALQFGLLDSVEIPSNSRITSLQKKVKKLKTKRAFLATEQQNRVKMHNDLQASAQGYWRSTTGKPAKSLIQSQIEQLSKSSYVKLSKMGVPVVKTVSDNISTIEFEVTSLTDIKKFANFVRDIENVRPALRWRTCTVRPNKRSEMLSIDVRGKITAYVLSKDASEFIDNNGEETP